MKSMRNWKPWVFSNVFRNEEKFWADRDGGIRRRGQVGQQAIGSGELGPGGLGGVTEAGQGRERLSLGEVRQVHRRLC